ncbi:ATP-dependent RNA helicase DDX24 [Brevipalpus obovatus]|uniref:ATP-dependent RNA helicase DDX24 n=1 Tax=Brevipalpus obovatus TaxID=246614 RepID=UPI003D9ED9CB
MDVDESKSSQECKSWEDLEVCPEIIKALLENGMQEPTPIQKGVIKSALTENVDVFAAAPTGSGKTYAFGIPLVQLISARKKAQEASKLRGLILTPTRELALQIKSHLDKILTHLDIKITAIVGGLSSQKQERIINRDKPDVIVATPGRLWQLINEVESSHLNHHSVGHVRFLVVDEADRMTERGYFAELHDILELIKEKGSNVQRRTFVVSATLTFVHKGPSKRKKPQSVRQKIRFFSKLIGMKNEKKVVDLTERGLGTPARDQLVIYKLDCLKEEKDLFLYYFLVKQPGKSLVFCNSKDCLRRLTNVLRCLKMNPIPLHGSMDQKRRLISLEKFSNNPQSILLASDVAARGLDISNIDHVIHYQVPRTSEIYVHRSGRTARMMNKGFSLILIEPKEKYSYTKLCNSLNESKDFPSYCFDEKTLNLLRPRVDLARKIDSLDHKLKKVKNENNFFQIMAKKCDIDLDERDDLIHKDCENDQKQRKQLKQLQAQLLKLLKKNSNFG